MSPRAIFWLTYLAGAIMAATILTAIYAYTAARQNRWPNADEAMIVVVAAFTWPAGLPVMLALIGAAALGDRRTVREAQAAAERARLDAIIADEHWIPADYDG